MTEIWRDITGYIGFYSVSNLGRVKSHARVVRVGGGGSRLNPERILQACTQKQGYLYVNLQGRTFLVHRLVAEAFIPNPENKPEVNHINAIKTNNRVTNLEWSTRIENDRHAQKLGLKPILKGEQHPNCKLSDAETDRIVQMYKSGMTYTQIADQFGITKRRVYLALKRVGALKIAQ